MKKTRSRHAVGRKPLGPGSIDTREFDAEFVVDEFRPLDAPARTRWAQARRKPGRPREGQGAKVISVSVENGLLEQTDRLARELGLTRARVIARGLRAMLAAEGRL